MSFRACPLLEGRCHTHNYSELRPVHLSSSLSTNTCKRMLKRYTRFSMPSLVWIESKLREKFEAIERWARHIGTLNYIMSAFIRHDYSGPTMHYKLSMEECWLSYFPCFCAILLKGPCWPPTHSFLLLEHFCLYLKLYLVDLYNLKTWCCPMTRKHIEILRSNYSWIVMQCISELLYSL